MNPNSEISLKIPASSSATPFHILFDRPQIPPNTGNAIRMCAGTGATLHLAKPYPFQFDDKHLRRAGLDYHDLAVVQQHESIDAALTELTSSPFNGRVFAFTAQAEIWHTAIEYQPGDVLLFGPEPTGLDPAVLSDARVHRHVRIPMLPGRRSMNLSNAAAVAAYEVWRQFGFIGAQ